MQDVVRQGLGPVAFPVGSQQTAHTAYTSIVWDVVAHDYNDDPDGFMPHSMTLLMHSVIYGRMFDVIEALYYVDETVPGLRGCLLVHITLRCLPVTILHMAAAKHISSRRRRLYPLAAIINGLITQVTAGNIKT